MRASLYATGCICEISDDFASISVEMLFNIMNSSSVPLPIKLDAAQVLAKCKSSYSVAYKAYKVFDHFIFSDFYYTFFSLVSSFSVNSS